MQTLSAKDAKYGFGRLIDLARASRWPSMGAQLSWCSRSRNTSG